MISTPGDPGIISVTDDERGTLAQIEQLMAMDQAASPKLVGAGGETVDLPASLIRVLQLATHHLTHGQMISLIPIEKELTTQQAADILNVSRPYLIKLLDQGELPYSKTGAHRRISLPEVLAFKERRDAQRREKLTELTRLSQELGLYDD